MANDDDQLERFGEAVEEKKQAAKEASEHPVQNPHPAAVRDDEQPERIDHAHEQDDRDVRAKNAGHGKKTADKWNQ
jgi:hypothetical protein